MKNLKTFTFPRNEDTIKIVAPLSLNKTLRMIDLAAGVIANSYYSSSVLVVSEYQSALSAFMFLVSNKKIKDKIITMETNEESTQSDNYLRTCRAITSLETSLNLCKDEKRKLYYKQSILDNKNKLKSLEQKKFTLIYDTVIVLYAKSDSFIKCSEKLIESFSENRPTFILDIKPTKSLVDRFGIRTRTNGRV